ncbi:MULTISPECIES: hypothetical protein [Sphingobacterium]|nr:hypothetical protein [Sphingobacterium paramultivorum]
MLQLAGVKKRTLGVREIGGLLHTTGHSGGYMIAFYEDALYH